MTNYINQIVKYTVSLNNLQKGTITAIELPEIKVGDFEKNVQFIDDCGNRMGRDGIITEIQKIEIITY